MVPSTLSLPCSIVLGSRGCGGFGLTQCDVGKHNVWITTARKSLTRPDPARLVAAVERFRLFKGSDFSPRTDAFCIGDPEIQSPGLCTGVFGSGRTPPCGLRGCRSSKSETSRRKCLKHLQNVPKYLKCSRERPVMCNSILKAAQRVINAPGGRDV